MAMNRLARSATILATLGLGQTVAVAQQVTITYGPVDVASVPTLSEWGMIVMAIILAVVAASALRKKANSRAVMSLVLGAAGLLSAALGQRVMSDALSIVLPEMSAPTGGQLTLPSNIGVVPVENATQVPLRIIGVSPTQAQDAPDTTCDPGVIVAPGSSCNVDTGNVT